MSTIRLFARRSCHLCDEARALIAAHARPGDVVEEVDVDADPALVDAYVVRVPVVEVDGVEIAQYHLDAHALQAALGG